MSISRLPVTQLKAMLQQLQLLGGFEVDGVNCPPPKVQLARYDETALKEDERVIAILSSGDNDPGNGALHRDLNMTIVFAGQADVNDLLTVAARADEIKETLLDNFEYECIYAVWPSEPQGPFFEDSGRVIYQIPLRVTINR